MEINFSQIGKDLADSKFSADAVIDKSTEAKFATESLNSVDKQKSVKEFSAAAETEDSNQKELSVDEIRAAVEDLRDFSKTTNRQLNFSYDEGSDKQVVKVTDAESGEVIRQIPSDEILRLSERIRELQSDLGETVGILFNKQV